MKNRLPFKSMGNALMLCCKGAIVGIGAILPGISGGVLCVAFGIYQPMMALLSHPIKAFREHYRMFIPFLIGWLAGFVLVARGVELLLIAASYIAMALFAGLICGTLPDLMKKSEQADEKQSWTAFIIPLAVTFAGSVFLKGTETSAIIPNALWYVFCGAVWGLSLVIPGLSSSSILIFIGLYQPMTAGIAALDFSVILPLLGGLALTVIASARLVNNLFEKRYALMSRIVLGIIIASTLLILPTSFESATDVLLCVLSFGGGFAASRYMDKISAIRTENQERKTKTTSAKTS